MKIFLLLIVTIVSSNSFSGVGGSVGGSSGGAFKFSKRLVTLEDFDGSLRHIVYWPLVIFENLGTPVKNVCLDGELVKTIKPIKVCSKTDVVEICTKTGGRGFDEYCRPVRKSENPNETNSVRLVMGCVSTIEKSFETSRFHEVDVCLKWKEVRARNTPN